MPNNGYQQYQKFILHGGAAFNWEEFYWHGNDLYKNGKNGKINLIPRLKTGTTNTNIWEVSVADKTYIIKKFKSMEATDYLQLKAWYEKSQHSNFTLSEFHPEIYYFEDEFVVMEKCDDVDVNKLTISMITEKLGQLHEYYLFHGDILNGEKINTGNLVFRGNKLLFIDPSIPNKGNPEKEQTLLKEMGKLNNESLIQDWVADLIEKQERKRKQDKKKRISEQRRLERQRQENQRGQKRQRPQGETKENNPPPRRNKKLGMSGISRSISFDDY